MPVFASGTGGSSDVPRVTFTNEPLNSPDLFVTKTVENALEGAEYAAPEHAAYRFALKLDGQVAKNVVYRVIDPEHGEIFCKNSMGMNVPFQTDSTGVFTLEAGWQAWFEGVGTGTRYEVIEQDTYLLPRTDDTGAEITVGGNKMYYVEGNTETVLHGQFDYETRSLAVDGFQKKSPAGGSTGEHSVLANGSYENFTNRYIGSGTGDTTQLTISKTISFPKDYEVPDRTPAFPFVIKLDGKAYADEPFTAINEKTQETQAQTTDSEGRFSLMGGWTAVFENVPVDVDYQVYEDTKVSQWPDGWWPTEDTEKVGATMAPLTELNFNNANVSFVVTKRLEDLTKPEQTFFEFRLADEENDAIGNVEYYLYNTTGKPVYREETELSEGADVSVNGRPIMTGMTDEQGRFYLEPGQAAVFIGLEPGTSYRVSETKNPAYTQVLPLPTVDTLHEVPADGQISMIDFVNRPESTDGTLTVTKSVSYGTGEGELSEDEFHFILYRRLTEEETEKLLGGTKEADIKSGLSEEKIILTEIQMLIRPGTGTEMQSESGSAALSKAAARAVISSGIASGGLIRYPFNNYRVTIGEKTYAVYAPVEGLIFSVPEGLEAPTYKTGPYAQQGWTQPGEFALKAGQTARFEEKVSVGDEYLVREIGLSEEYQERTSEQGALLDGYCYAYTALPDDGSLGQGVLVQTGMVKAPSTITNFYGETYTSPGGLSLNFENIYTPKKIDLQLTKVDGDGETIENEAHFMLYRTKGQDSPVVPEGEDADTYVYKTTNGVLTIPDLKAGTYWLYERKAPSGYCLLPEPVEINLTWTEDGLTVTIDGKAYTAPEDEAAVKSDAIGKVEIISAGTSEGQANTILHLEVRNTELYELPSSGGIGIYWYSIGGTLLMLAAALILYKYQRQGRC